LDQEVLDELERRLGPAELSRRLGLERNHEARMADRRSPFGIKHWYAAPWIIESALRLSGLYRRARGNAERVELRKNIVRSNKIPKGFDGFLILHMSDLHADMNQGAIRILMKLIPDLNFDICVMTGDYRGRTYGPFDATLEAMARLRHSLQGPIYGVLGNHDTIRMVPGLEAIGIRMLLNESLPVAHNGDQIHVAGIDDAHHYRSDNLEKPVSEIPDQAFSILLSHTPEIYWQAADAGFDLLLAGHTHGGQLCLPGSIPVTLDADLPRRMGSGAWKHREMDGYTSVGVGTSVVAARLNCPPEVTLHRLERSEPR
jgi:predicted MPP superfamily phosphohydrolase